MSRRKGLSLAQQAFALRRNFPAGGIDIKPSRLIWTGILTPTPLSCDYAVRITYAIRQSPRVVVLDPSLVPDECGRLPHLYRDGSLCLHEVHEWDRSMLLIDSIIPWASEWLAHYELWKWSGQWYGDGEPAERAATVVPVTVDDNGARGSASRPRTARSHGGRQVP